MKRIQFIEVEDMPWCPGFIRKGITDFLEIFWRIGIPRKTIVARLGQAMEKTGDSIVVDLCSGGGGPWRELVKDFNKRPGFSIQVCLTDLQPNLDKLRYLEETGQGSIRFLSESVDATAVPDELSGFRTIFGAFHHLPPDMAQSILADAARKGRGIAIFESTKRSWPVLAACLGTPFLLLAATPFIRPFQWSRLFWTYLLPVIPLALLFDSIMSCLRTYSQSELAQMTRGLGKQGYTWEIGEDLSFPYPVPMVYCIGCPAGKSD